MQEYEKTLLAELESLREENKGLKEYADSRDESISVYREEIKKLKADLKLNAEMLAKQCDLAREVCRYMEIPEEERTAVQKAKLKALHDYQYWMQHCYDYDDDDWGQ